LVEYSQEAPDSRPATLMEALVVRRSVAEVPVSAASASVGAAGAAVSRVKEVVPAELAFPAASVAVAETETVPFPRVVRSAAARTTATGVAPLPVTVLVTELAPRVKTTATLEPDSAVTVTTPPAAVASEEVAPPEMPVPRASVGAAGAVVSSLWLRSRRSGNCCRLREKYC
jgi:hypothetical protein